MVERGAEEMSCDSMEAQQTLQTLSAGLSVTSPSWALPFARCRRHQHAGCTGGKHADPGQANATSVNLGCVVNVFSFSDVKGHRLFFLRDKFNTSP